MSFPDSSPLPGSAPVHTDLLLGDAGDLADTEELRHGLRQLLAGMGPARVWQQRRGSEPWPSPADLLSWSDAAAFMVVCQPALMVSAGLWDELHAHLAHSGCVLPDDPRSPGAPPVDYGSRLGFEAFQQRLRQRERLAPADGRAPLLFLVGREALADCVQRLGSALNWAQVPAQCPDAVIARHAWVHDWSGYAGNSREDMLALLPDDVNRLLDVGGGDGAFVRAFVARRGGVGHLLEPGQAAERAARLGVPVFRHGLGEAPLPQRYDAVSLLDVLEHLEDPHHALGAVRGLLHPGGYLLLSVPNAAFWPVTAALLRGRFDYEAIGPQCVTHLRFYTAASLRALLAEHAYTVLRWEDVPSPMPADLAQALAPLGAAGLADLAALNTESFHVLARRD